MGSSTSKCGDFFVCKKEPTRAKYQQKRDSFNPTNSPFNECKFSTVWKCSDQKRCLLLGIMDYLRVFESIECSNSWEGPVIYPKLSTRNTIFFQEMVMFLNWSKLAFQNVKPVAADNRLGSTQNLAHKSSLSRRSFGANSLHANSTKEEILVTFCPKNCWKNSYNLLFWESVSKFVKRCWDSEILKCQGLFLRVLFDTSKLQSLSTFFCMKLVKTKITESQHLFLHEIGRFKNDRVPAPFFCMKPVKLHNWFE